MGGWLNLSQSTVIHLLLEQHRNVHHVTDVENNYLSNIQSTNGQKTLAGGMTNLPNLYFRELHCQNSWSEKQLGKVYLEVHVFTMINWKQIISYSLHSFLSVIF
jgi:hypothetical protein